MAENLPFESLYTEELYQVPRKTTIVITEPWDKLSAEEKGQLKKIAEALRSRISPKLGLDAFSVVHVGALDLSQWIEKPDKLIYFGPAIKGLNSYEVIEAGGTKMVLSESLSQLISDEVSKSKLWHALKELFSS